MKISTRRLADAPTVQIGAADPAGLLLPLAAPEPGDRQADDVDEAPLAPVIPLRPRPLPVLGAYDQLLPSRQHPDTGTDPGGTP